MADKIILSERTTLLYIDENNDPGSDLYLDWFEKWRLEHRVVKDHAVNNNIYQIDILCSKAALDALPKDIQEFNSRWETEGIIEDSRQERQEEIEYQDRALFGEETPTETYKVALKNKLQLQKK